MKVISCSGNDNTILYYLFFICQLFFHIDFVLHLSYKNVMIKQEYLFSRQLNNSGFIQKSNKEVVNKLIMKILILGGFLGSGKTTALYSLAHYIVDHTDSDSRTKVIILENEIGQNGIDDKFLKSGGLQVENLFSGCACCSVSVELLSTITKIQETCNPEWIILETTGIAYPKKIQENVETYLKLETRIAVLVDAVRWNRILIPMNALLSGQIIGSDAVLINKTDLADEAVLQKIEEDIRNFDDRPSILRISAIQGVEDAVWKEVLNN